MHVLYVHNMDIANIWIQETFSGPKVVPYKQVLLYISIVLCLRFWRQWTPEVWRECVL